MDIKNIGKTEKISLNDFKGFDSQNKIKKSNKRTK